MKTYTPEMIQETLRLHALWLSGEPEGAYADLRYADLRGVDLRGCKFSIEHFQPTYVPVKTTSSHQTP